MTSSCPGSLTRRPRRRIQAPSTRATRGAISRKARPRCETASFSSGLSSAGEAGVGVLVGDEEHVVPERRSPAARGSRARTSCRARPRPHPRGRARPRTRSGRRGAHRGRRRAGPGGARCCARPPAPSLPPQGRRPSGRRARRACRSGRRRRGRCRRRARAGRCSRSPRALEQRVPLEGGLVLDRFVVPLDVVDAEHLASGAYSRRRRSISTIFLRLREARKIRVTGTGPPTAGGSGRRSPSPPARAGRRARPVERGGLGGALHLDEPAVAGHDHVHVGVGADVLLVGEVEAGRRR